VRDFLEQIPAQLRRTIAHFTTDMWEGYLTAIEEYIAAHDDVEARLVIDRFHVAQHYRDDFDQLRKQELKRLKKELRPAVYEQDCKGTLGYCARTMPLWMMKNAESCGDCWPIRPNSIKLIRFGKN